MKLRLFTSTFCIARTPRPRGVVSVTGVANSVACVCCGCHPQLCGGRSCVIAMNTTAKSFVLVGVVMSVLLAALVAGVGNFPQHRTGPLPARRRNRQRHGWATYPPRLLKQCPVEQVHQCRKHTVLHRVPRSDVRTDDQAATAACYELNYLDQS